VICDTTEKKMIVYVKINKKTNVI